MNITECRIFVLENSKTLALASITIDNDFVVTGLRVLNGSNGLFISMPSRKDGQGEYHDICFPLTQNARMTLQDTVLKMYNATVNPTPIDVMREQGKKNREAPLIDVSEDTLPF